MARDQTEYDQGYADGFNRRTRGLEGSDDYLDGWEDGLDDCLDRGAEAAIADHEKQRLEDR